MPLFRQIVDKLAVKTQTVKKITGDEAERLAEKFLLKHGLRCIDRNYHCRFGEIDLILHEPNPQNKAENILVFTEVRLRKNAGFGGAAASIGHHKQRRIIAAAQHYLSGLREQPQCRFDAVLLNDLSGDGIEWIKDAFQS